MVVYSSHIFRKKSSIGKMTGERSMEEKAMMIKIKNEFLER